MRLCTVCIWSTFIYLISIVDGKGSPILIKTEGKKLGKGGKELMILGGGCSPVLIKNGNDKKGKKNSQMIISGGGDCGEKKIKIIKIPHYVPFVVHKSHVVHVPKVIYRHHYVKVPQVKVVVRRVPVPVHVPQYIPVIQKEVHMMYDHYNKQRRRSYRYR